MPSISCIHNQDSNIIILHHHQSDRRYIIIYNIIAIYTAVNLPTIVCYNVFVMYLSFSVPVYLCARAFLRWSSGILVVVVQNRPLTPICFPGFHTIHITHHSFLKSSRHHLWQIILGVSPYINVLSVFRKKNCHLVVLTRMP